MGRSVLFLLPVLLLHLNQPLIISLILALIPPARHPLARFLIVDQLLPALLIRKRSTRLVVVLADALLARE